MDYFRNANLFASHYVFSDGLYRRAIAQHTAIKHFLGDRYCAGGRHERHSHPSESNDW